MKRHIQKALPGTATKPRYWIWTLEPDGRGGETSIIVEVGVPLDERHEYVTATTKRKFVSGQHTVYMVSESTIKTPVSVLATRLKAWREGKWRTISLKQKQASVTRSGTSRDGDGSITTSTRTTSDDGSGDVQSKFPVT